MPAPCLAFLLGTPDEPGVVVTYRCTRRAGHPGAEHADEAAGITWTSERDVTWESGAVYPHHTGWPWDDTPAPAPAPAPEPQPVAPVTIARTQRPAYPAASGWPWPITAAPPGQPNAANGTVNGVTPPTS
jgi:hypothetical protein